MQKRFRVVAVGGTFDELHKGHKALLAKAFEIGDQVTVGLASDEFVNRMAKPHITASYKERMKELESFLSDQGLLQRAKVILIDDACGALLLSNSLIEALVVSKETESTALRINEKRTKKGLPVLTIVTIGMVPSENHNAISTTRIRRGEIDREGHLLKS
ncbi:pantetheine-phosphate adenylyltransferase [Candidatus Bathyarchaeota archaeon]|nr:pantetheine-phosphate adenylyltransferase [Candidatus Bathyarchaeota archaeon]